MFYLWLFQCLYTVQRFNPGFLHQMSDVLDVDWQVLNLMCFYCASVMHSEMLYCSPRLQRVIRWFTINFLSAQTILVLLLWRGSVCRPSTNRMFFVWLVFIIFFVYHYLAETLETFVCKNPRRSQDHLAPSTMPWLKWLRSHFLFILMLDVNIKWSSSLDSAWVYAFCFCCPIIEWLDTSINEQLYWCS